MPTCDAGDGSFISYINEYQHWTFPKHSRERFVTLNGLIPRLNLNNPKWNMIPHCKSSCIVLNVWCVPQHIALVLFSQEYPWSRKLKHRVWARLEKRPDDQCLCTSLSVISDYTINGSTSDLGKPCDLTHLPLMPHICASEKCTGLG